MKKRTGALLLFLLVFSFITNAFAASSFTDTRFQGVFTTENLDAIREEYELEDGWFWTTRGNEIQTYHGFFEKPGWTDTSVNKLRKKAYIPGWYGCRWNTDKVFAVAPSQGGWGECFGFAQFIGYLLSGDRNPHREWDFYYSLEKAGGFRVGDIVRVDYRANKKQYRHSAVVYAVSGNEVLFLQVSGGNYNRISVGMGFTDGNHTDEKDPEVISGIPSFKICRSPLSKALPEEDGD